MSANGTRGLFQIGSLHAGSWQTILEGSSVSTGPRLGHSSNEIHSLGTSPPRQLARDLQGQNRRIYISLEGRFFQAMHRVEATSHPKVDVTVAIIADVEVRLVIRAVEVEGFRMGTISDGQHAGSTGTVCCIA